MASRNGGSCESEGETRRKSGRWRGILCIAVASCLFALLVGPLRPLIAGHQSVRDEGTTARDTDWRRTKPQAETDFTSGKSDFLFGDK